MKSAMFQMNPDKCNGCGRCIQVCSENMTVGTDLKMFNGKTVMSDRNNFGWRMR